MAQFILRVEGVDFDNTVFDTQNLSIIRGSSLALLNAPRRVRDYLEEKYNIAREDTIFTGASQGAFKLNVPNKTAAEAIATDVMSFLHGDCLGPLPTSHLSFVVDVVEGDDMEALKRAHAKNRLSQMQEPRWPLPAFVEGTKGFAKNYDRLRPATEKFDDPKEKPQKWDNKPHQNQNNEEENDAKSEVPLLSKSGYDRRKYGIDQKHNFYKSFCAFKDSQNKNLPYPYENKAKFCNSFEAIVGDPPTETPLALRNKIAVFYADGNKFSRLFNSQKDLADYTTLSEYIVGEQRSLITAIVKWLYYGAYKSDGEFAIKAYNQNGELLPAFRFETLLWGGEELLFVMPAWLGLAFAQGFFDCVKNWKVPPGIQHAAEPLTFSAGLIFCNRKTPIRQAKKVAKDLAEAGKDMLGDDISAQKNVINIEMFESIAMPDADVSGYRERLYGITGEDKDEKLKSLLTLEASTFDAALKLIAKMKDQFPRSQVYKFIRSAKENGVFDVGDKKPDNGKPDAFNETVELYFERAGAGSEDNLNSTRCMPQWVYRPIDAPDEKLPLNFLSESMLLADKSIEKCQSLAYSCAFIAQFWDYVNPTGGEIPKLSPNSATHIDTMGGAE